MFSHCEDFQPKMQILDWSEHAIRGETLQLQFVIASVKIVL